MNFDVRIDACKQGEREALGMLYKAYAGRLMKICRCYVADESAAEDILHDAFIIIFSSIHSLKDNAKLEGWMITIVKNLALKYLQSSERNNLPLSTSECEWVSEEANETCNIELEQLLAAVELLPKGNREVFKLSVLDGLSHQEIGKLLGINPHSSSSQLARAKRMLRAILVNYRALLLVLLLLPLYIYFHRRERSVGSNDKKTAAVGEHKHTRLRAKQQEMEGRMYARPERVQPSNQRCDAEKMLASEHASAEKSATTQLPNREDAKHCGAAVTVDSLWKSMASVTLGTTDTVWYRPQNFTEELMALNGNVQEMVKKRKKDAGAFHFGYTALAGANGAGTHVNYLSLIDYANGGSAVKLYTRADLENYYQQNSELLDSVERVRISTMLQEPPVDGDNSLGEVVRHERPQTYGLYFNVPFNANWTLGTGVTFTRLKSVFESKLHAAKLVKTQKIDYVGLPLRFTYNIYNTGRLYIYATGGVSFEVPFKSSLNKKYIVTADSVYTQQERIKAGFQLSTNIGVGVQYKLFKPFSLYLEPNVFYYFKNNTGVETYRTTHPFVMTVPFGLRLTW